MAGDRIEAPDRAAHAEGLLLRSGAVEALDFQDPSALDDWARCDLASMVEGCFHRTIDPAALDPDARERWRDRLAESYLPPGFRDDAWMTRYLWLLDRGARVGTIALPTRADGSLDLGIWSLYVRPEHRGRGLASRALSAAYDAALAVGLRGIRLETHWVWQRALRFYLARGMWVTSWKAAVQLSRWSALPPWALELERPGRATFRVRRGDAWIPLYEARREPGGVALREIPEGRAGADELSSERLYATPTFAVALATRGWPLPTPTAGAPPGADAPLLLGVADALSRFEAIARQRGWDVRVP